MLHLNSIRIGLGWPILPPKCPPKTTQRSHHSCCNEIPENPMHRGCFSYFNLHFGSIGVASPVFLVGWVKRYFQTSS